MNKDAIKAFEDHKVKVVTLSDADYHAWLDVAKKELLREIRQGRAERPEADRRSARGQIASIEKTRPATISPAGRQEPRRAKNLCTFSETASAWTLFIRAVTFLSRVAGVFAALLIGVAVLVICDMVIERYILNLTTIWQIDVVTYCIVARDLHRQRLCADDARPRERGNSSALSRSARALLAGAGHELLALAFCVVLFVLCTQFWYEAWMQNWRSNTVWRARLWIPYLSMPVGLGLLVLQYVADLICAGDRARAAVRPRAERRRRGVRPRTGQAGARRRAMSPAIAGLARSRRDAADAGVGHPGGLRARRRSPIVFLLLFHGFDSMHVVAETF